jgi:hypothetical protein
MRSTLRLPALVVCIALAAAVGADAQAVRRLQGRVAGTGGAPLANAEVRAEALFGYAAGTFAGQRTFTTKTDGKGAWNILGIKAGVWAFDISAPGYLPETVVLPIQVLATESSMQAGMAYNWQLVLNAAALPAGDDRRVLEDAQAAARSGDADRVRSLLSRVSESADADYLAGGGRIAVMARDAALARALFARALERDPSSYRAALGIASTFMMQRDFDSASKAFDAARTRTHDKDEQKFLTIALADLATIKVR